MCTTGRAYLVITVDDDGDSFIATCVVSGVEEGEEKERETVAQNLEAR